MFSCIKISQWDKRNLKKNHVFDTSIRRSKDKGKVILCFYVTLACSLILLLGSMVRCIQSKFPCVPTLL
jgi:hypothetical protein